MRLIDADELLTRYKARCEGCKETKNYCEHCCDIADIIYDIEDAPTIEERVKGKWIVVKRHEHYPSGKPYEQLQCPFCKRFDNNGDGNFCGYCGADMREETDDAEIH